MKIAVLTETRPGETRVAASPETVKKLAALGAEIVVQSGAGAPSNFADAAYSEAGAAIASSAADAARGADLVLKVQRPTIEELSLLGRGAKLIAILSPHA
ncbi:MAG: NAD(P)(+) transhydrogenase (Re/Si-specific) subunit alpha, partial [Roseovarius confluentis]